MARDVTVRTNQLKAILNREPCLINGLNETTVLVSLSTPAKERSDGKGEGAGAGSTFPISRKLLSAPGDAVVIVGDALLAKPGETFGKEMHVHGDVCQPLEFRALFQ